jgi:ATP-dependent Clp protease ATP-binding subunit ClpX
MAKKKESMSCSFCGRPAGEVNKLITGPGVYICDECVETCSEIVLGEESEITQGGAKKESSIELEKLPTPHEMKAFLDNYIIGQDEAKIGVVVAAYNHYKRLRSRGDDDGVEIEKSNIMLLGPTGTGKTLIAQSLAKLLDVPFTIVDATVFTEAGYVGEDVENILVRLLAAANHDIKKAEQGIIYIDEFDKIGRKGANASITRDVSGEGVQQSLLKILEGTEAQVPPKGGRKHPEQKLVTINTKDILFLCGGAFVGLEEIIEKRTSKGGMGFNADVVTEQSRLEDELYQLCEPDDIVQFGIIPELVGRIPAVFALKHLDSSMLLKILTEPKNAIIKQYKKLFKMEGAELTFSDGALNHIVEVAAKKKTGARGLRAVLEKALTMVMYDLPSKKGIKEVIIGEDVFTDNGEPEYKKAN